LAQEALQSLFAELSALEIRIKVVEAVIMREHRSNAVSRRLTTIPGIGPITASALAGTIADPLAFKSGRELAAWIGLVPRQHSSGGKQKMGRVSLSAAVADRGCYSGHAAAARQNRWAFAVGQSAAGSTSVPVGLIGTCQQDGPHCLGDNGETRDLQSFSNDRRGLKQLH
jgi:hypothetical protein